MISIKQMNNQELQEQIDNLKLDIDDLEDENNLDVRFYYDELKVAETEKELRIKNKTFYSEP